MSGFFRSATAISQPLIAEFGAQEVWDSGRRSEVLVIGRLGRGAIAWKGSGLLLWLRRSRIDSQPGFWQAHSTVTLGCA